MSLSLVLSRREFALAVLLAATALVAWWLQLGRDAPNGEPRAEVRRPDYVVDGLTGVILDAEGQPSRRMDAEQLRHYPDDGSSELDEPVLVVYGEMGPAWWARARQAWVNASGDEVLLQERVRLRRAAMPDAAAIELRTSELLVLPELDYAETARFVEIEQAQDWLTGANGMRAWLGDASRIQVFGRVRAHVDDPGDDDSG